MLKTLLLAVSVALVGGSMVAPMAGTSVAFAKKAKKAKRKVKRAKKKEKKTFKSKDEATPERTQPIQFDLNQRGGEDMDARADKKRDEAIAKLKKLLPTIGEGPQKGELIFRLSEMYWTKAKFLHLRAMQNWDQSLDAWYKKGSKGKQPQFEDQPAAAESSVFKREALKLYEELLAKYPRYPRKDEVLYNLGSSLYESGKQNQGVKMYWKLIKQFPNSGYAPDAWLQLGEHFFNNNKLVQATKAYSKAAETKKPRIYSFALYKLAWCDYNMGDYEKAIKKFREVVEYSKTQKSGDVSKGEMAKRDRIQLMSEALNDMVRTYSHLDSVDEAFGYYQREVGKDKAYRYLTKLGKLYDKEGKYQREIDTFRRLNKEYPYRAQAPQNQTAILSAYVQLDQKEQVRKEVRQLIDLYSPKGEWAERNAGNEDVLAAAFDVVEGELAKLVTEQHRAAQQTKLVDTYKLARDIYREYLDKFENSVNSYKFRFFYGEILYDLAEYKNAAEVYDRVVLQKPDGEFVKPASYAAVLSWEKVVNNEQKTLGKKITEQKRGKSKGKLSRREEVQKLEKGKSYEPKQLTEVEKSLADACDRFVKYAPKDEDALKVKFKAANMYFAHNQFEEAADRFGEIIAKRPKDKLARVGAEAILESFNIRKDWSNLNKWARKFRTNKSLTSDKKFKNVVAEFVEGASFNEILFVYEPKEGPANTAERYAGFVDEFPKSKYVLVGLFNSIINYDKANQLEKALKRAHMYLEDYAKFTISKDEIAKSNKKDADVALPEPNVLREKVLFMVGEFYDRLAEFETAAQYFEQYAKEFKTEKRRADALFNAGVFREALGQFDKAIDNFKTYMREYPKKKDRLEVAWRVGGLYEKKDDPKEVKEYYTDFIGLKGSRDASRVMCAQYKIFKKDEALEKFKKPKDLLAAYSRLLEQYKKLPQKAKADDCPLMAAGEAAFHLLEPEYQNYMELKLEGNEKKIAKRLIQKLKLVEELQGKYTQVLGIGQGDYGIASLYRIGQIYQDLAQGIFDTPCPRKLTADQCDIYQAALQEKAFPLEEKAIEAYDKALKKAYELGLYNDWLIKTQAAITKYEPGRFPEIRDYPLIAAKTNKEVAQLLEVNP